MKANEKIEKFMTKSPHCVNSGLPIKKARELMKEYGIRHLPVRLAGHLVGVITDRDLKLAESFDRDGKLLVDDAMTPDPFTVAPGTELAEVAETMAKQKYGCAVVQGTDGQVIGVFTAVDGLRALGKALKPGPKKTIRRKGKQK